MHMHFAQPVAIFSSGLFTSPMVDTLRAVSPGTQAGINALCIRGHQRPQSHGLFDARFDGLVLHIGEPIADHLTAPLEHAKDGWSCLLQGTTATLAFASA